MFIPTDHVNHIADLTQAVHIILRQIFHQARNRGMHFRAA